MKNLLFCALLGLALVSTSFLNAQTRTPHEKTSMQSLLLYQKLLKSESSLKTTNSAKRLSGSSWYNSAGILKDSFRVLEASSSGYSKLSQLYFYAYIGESVPSVPYYEKYPYTVSHSDFNKALFFEDGDPYPDTIIRVMNANGNISSEDHFYYSQFLNSLTLDRSIYTYDNQNRLVDLKVYADKGTPLEEQYQSTFYYSTNGNYAIANYDIGTSWPMKDSVVLNNGNIEVIYNEDPAFSRTYYYNYSSTGQLVHMEYWRDTNLIEFYNATPHIGSDFPEWFEIGSISSTNDTSVVTGVFVFDSATGFIKSAWYDNGGQTSSSFLDFQFLTDGDGDIIAYSMSDSLGSILERRYFYYDSTTSTKNLEGYFAGIKVYPVPAQDVVHIESLQSLDGYNLYDSKGQKLKSENLSEAHSFELDINAYSSGLYFVELHDDEHSKTVIIHKE